MQKGKGLLVLRLCTCLKVNSGWAPTKAALKVYEEKEANHLPAPADYGGPTKVTDVPGGVKTPCLFKDEMLQ